MMNETVFLAGCPVVRPEGIYYEGRRVIRLAPNSGLGDVGDLFAYRQEWEPFIKAHIDLWRNLNDRFEEAERTSFVGNTEKKPCPAGIFTPDQIPAMSWGGGKSWCSALSLTRMMVSTTDPRGILPRWNAWNSKSSAQILAGAADMLSWLQSVVLQVGGPDKDKLLSIAKEWGLESNIKLPELPSFSTQQEIIARTEGAYTTTKGLLQLIGYGAGEQILTAANVEQAVSKGLTDTAKELPQTTRWIGIAAVVTAVVVGGILIVYYKPRREPERPERSYALPAGA